MKRPFSTFPCRTYFYRAVNIAYVLPDIHMLHVNQHEYACGVGCPALGQFDNDAVAVQWIFLAYHKPILT